MAMPFTIEEKQFIRDNYPILGDVIISFLVNCRRGRVKAFAHRSGIKVLKAVRTAHAVRINTTRKLSEETKRRIGDGHRKYKPFVCAKCGKPISHYRTLCWGCYKNNCSGSQNNNWRGGITSLNMLARRALYEVWNVPIYARDNYTCQICGDDRGHNLTAHHIKPFKQIRDDVVAANKHLNLKRFEDRKIAAQRIIDAHDTKTGITLCSECHRKIHRKKRGELLGRPIANGEGNQQPSRSNVISMVDRKVQRLTGEDSQPISPTRAPRTLKTLA